ncbi:MAG: protease HtpX [Gammaproteobacteria bacterium]|nr:protease HtpX [Gammaproteobacteria bacterium]
MSRIFLFLATNLAVLFVLGTVVQLLGLDVYLAEQGMNYSGLLIMAAVFGMGGSFISLALSKFMAKRMTGAQVIQQPRTEEERWLTTTVERQARVAGIGMPEVAIYPGAEVNAFATGMSRNKALVAVSRGLLNQMTRDEAEAVLAHEITHVANGDMVTLSLLQGILNTFVIFLAHIIGRLVDRVVFKNERGTGIGFFMVYMAAQMLLGIVASVIVMWFSRRREYRADAGGAQLAGRNKMIAALQRLQAQSEPGQLPDEMAAFGISGGGSGFKRLFMSHPPLAERIDVLRRG